MPEAACVHETLGAGDIYPISTLSCGFRPPIWGSLAASKGPLNREQQQARILISRPNVKKQDLPPLVVPLVAIYQLTATLSLGRGQAAGGLRRRT